MSLAAGDRLGPYEVTAPIGVGGMGEVYRAHDGRLNREVAIKVSAEQFRDRSSVRRGPSPGLNWQVVGSSAF